ncbi:MAG: septation protein SepH [Streptosporangiaceae bacterium]
MQQLRLIAVSEDGSFAILDVPGRGGRYSLLIDDRLRTVARGQFSRLAQYEIEVESPLRPKEIQDRIRAGEKADEIADAAGVPIERVRRFEGPVLAEREYRAQEAQRVTVRSPGDSGPGPRLGEIVAERLAEIGASADDVRWDSRKRADGNWQVQLEYAVSGEPQLAEWVFDPRSRHVTPSDDEAIRLCLPEAEWPAPRVTGPGSATATVTPIGSRLAQAQPADPRASRDRQEAGTSAAPPAAAASAGRPAMPVGPSRPAGMVPGTGPGGPGRALPPEPPAAGPARREQYQPGDDAPEQAAGEQPAHQPTGTEQASREHDTPPARPGRKAVGGRSRRASVPSWDEIMLGNSRQPD